MYLYIDGNLVASQATPYSYTNNFPYDPEAVEVRPTSPAAVPPVPAAPANVPAARPAPDEPPDLRWE